MSHLTERTVYARGIGTAMEEMDSVAAGPLAEFDALRQELITRITLQHQVLTLQLATAGGVFTLVLSNLSRTPALLVIPFTTCLFAGHYSAINDAIQSIATYFETKLSPKVAGGLSWEEWLRKRTAEQDKRKSRNPLLQGYSFWMAFVGAAALAVVFTLVWTIFQPVSELPNWVKVLYYIGCGIGALTTAISIFPVLSVTRPIEKQRDRE